VLYNSLRTFKELLQNLDYYLSSHICQFLALIYETWQAVYIFEAIYGMKHVNHEIYIYISIAFYILCPTWKRNTVHGFVMNIAIKEKMRCRLHALAFLYHHPCNHLSAYVYTYVYVYKQIYTVYVYIYICLHPIIAGKKLIQVVN